jgi:hypothetical protein
MRHKPQSLLALLFIAPVLTAGCGGTSSSPKPEQHALTKLGPNEQGVLAALAHAHGRAYVQASKNLPDQVETP